MINFISGFLLGTLVFPFIWFFAIVAWLGVEKFLRRNHIDDFDNPMCR